MKMQVMNIIYMYYKVIGELFEKVIKRVYVQGEIMKIIIIK